MLEREADGGAEEGRTVARVIKQGVYPVALSEVAHEGAYLESRDCMWRLWDEEPTEEQSKAEPWRVLMDVGKFDAAFGTAMENLKAMNRLILDDEAADYVIRLIEQRIEFISGLPEEHYGEYYSNTKLALLGELYTLKMMVSAMAGKLEIDDSVEGE